MAKSYKQQRDDVVKKTIDNLKEKLKDLKLTEDLIAVIGQSQFEAAEQFFKEDVDSVKLPNVGKWVKKKKWEYRDSTMNGTTEEEEGEE